MKQIVRKYNYLLASLLVLGITFFIYKGIDSVIVSKKQIQTHEVYQVQVNKIPILKEKLPKQEGIDTSLSQVNTFEEFSKTITAKSAYVEDIDTGSILYERNSDRILLPASTTKLMTALVALEEYSLDDTVIVPDLPDLVGFTYDFKSGEALTVANLLKAALIESNNDAAYILALSSKDGLQGFVGKMNQKAKDLHLINTQYENPAGFDNDIQRTSAHDLVILSKEFMNNEFLSSVVVTKEAVITDVSGEFKHYLTSTHQLLGTDPTVVGIKTGTTQGAAQVLITQFRRENHNIIVVVMGSDDRYLETIKLIDWVLSAYVWVSPEELI